MSSTVTCRVLLKNYNDLKNITIGEVSPDFEYQCQAYQYCCYNYTVPHSPWCCDASYRIIYKDWYLWVILSLITILILATFFYFRFYQKRQLERRIIRATLEIEAHYRPLQYQRQVVFSRPGDEDDDKSWHGEEDDPPPCYSEISPDSSPPSYSSNKNIVVAGDTAPCSASSAAPRSASTAAPCSASTAAPRSASASTAATPHGASALPATPAGS